MDDVIKYADDKQLAGLIVSLDYQKAFDSISKEAIMSALEQFNFGPKFQKYIKTILTNTQSTIKNGGWFSNIFKTERGIRQGCAVSPLIFILVVELLAIKLRQNNKIKGMLEEDSIRGSIKVLQYADDMSLLLKNDDSLGHALKDIEEFTGISGLKLNINKSIGMRVGSSKNNPPGDQGIKRINNNENIKILGIYFNASQESSTIEENWKPQVEKIKILIKRWSKRDLSLYGKVVIAKSLLLSKLNYVIQSLAIPDDQVKEIDRIIFKFLWQKKHSNKKAFEKIKRTVLCKHTQEGGLGMISVRHQQDTFKIQWILNIIKQDQHNSLPYKIVNNLCKGLQDFHYALKSTVGTQESGEIESVKSKFWKSCIQTWLDAKVNKSQLENIEELGTQPLLNNTKIRYKDKPIWLNKWIKNNVMYLYQMFHAGRWKTLEEIKQAVLSYPGIRVDYFAITHAVKMEDKIRLSHYLDQNPHVPAEWERSSKKVGEHFHLIMKLKNKELRKLILENETTTLSCEELWRRKYGTNMLPYFEEKMVHRIHKNERLVDPSHLDETQHNLPTQVNVDSPILYGQWVLRLNSFYDGAFHPSKCFNLTISWKRPPIFCPNQTIVETIQLRRDENYNTRICILNLVAPARVMTEAPQAVVSQTDTSVGQTLLGMLLLI
ncbi:retrovirus-related Pol polyprotein from type-1 retrotransposable element R2 [Elysia marginata]|uniref:Retrovirus-related Pol polyprotein from type-1 retrotransposable element R2 n=1 Tax=Elysia marginata TaxID=1093978 RepID=A0AAV4H5D4_9GAST|nr:retrovirus-related Pol polyprotein from type-1 retrotransposable element R2 [Elysia marginata]